MPPPLRPTAPGATRAPPRRQRHSARPPPRQSWLSRDAKRPRLGARPQEAHDTHSSAGTVDIRCRATAHASVSPGPCSASRDASQQPDLGPHHIPRGILTSQRFMQRCRRWDGTPRPHTGVRRVAWPHHRRGAAGPRRADPARTAGPRRADPTRTAGPPAPRHRHRPAATAAARARGGGGGGGGTRGHVGSLPAPSCPPRVCPPRPGAALSRRSSPRPWARPPPRRAGVVSPSPARRESSWPAAVACTSTCPTSLVGSRATDDAACGAYTPGWWGGGDGGGCASGRGGRGGEEEGRRPQTPLADCVLCSPFSPDAAISSWSQVWPGGWR